MAGIMLNVLYLVPHAYADHVQQETPAIVEAPGCVGEYAGRAVSEEALQVILDDHAKWVSHPSDSSGKPANLCGAELSGADFREQDLSGANFQGANLSRADFTAAILVHVNFHKANLTEASLYAADMRGANVSGGLLRLANFRKANLSQTNFSEADLREANLAETRFRLGILRGANLEDAYLVGADLEMANGEGSLPGSCGSPRSQPSSGVVCQGQTHRGGFES